MNKSRILTTLSSVCFIAVLSSCSSLVSLNVRLLEPAAVFWRPEINTVALVNRAVPPKSKANTIESIITMEGYNEDKQGRQQILQALNNALTYSPRLKSKLTGYELKGDGSGTTFPKPLGWDTVANICKENEVDALVVLETYDSDAIITQATGDVSVNNQYGIPIPTVHIYATQKITIKAGFRIYDPKNKIIIDQYTFSYWRTWNGSASTIGEAIASMINREQAINQTSQDAGTYYEKRLSPTWLNERRYLYKKSGRGLFAIGSRMALVGSWNEAADYWKQVLKNSPNRRKLCGKATYNLALAAEINGNLAEAKEWISKSYGFYNNREAPYYQNTINRRYNAMLQLNQQMQQSDPK
ncbi:MAG: hypothetical protein K2Q22_00015 [Cytophagales bacterium]|nr:hypothetical protein [Cytophagales bacterium]